MNAVLLTIVALLYGTAAADAAWRGQWGMATVLMGYVVANVGLIVLGGRV